jgi:hypothetical protein
VAWLQPVYEKYRDLGMQVAANRVHLALEAKSKAAPAGMKRLEVPIDINPDAVGEARMRETLRRTEFRSYFFPCSSA